MKTINLIPTLETPVLHLGDNLEKIRHYPDNSVHAIIIDAPYGLNTKIHNVQELVKQYQQGQNYILGGKGFNGEEWDSDLPTLLLCKELFRVLKPGGFIVCFSATRTYDIMAFTLRWVGFEIKDQLIWAYASGVPKGQWLDKKMKGDPQAHLFTGKNILLKPAQEPIVLAQKPPEFEDVAENIKKWGTGALNLRAAQAICSDGESRYSANIITDGSPTIREAFNGGDRYFNSCPPDSLDKFLNPNLFYSKASAKEKDFGLDLYTPKKYRKAAISGNETKIKNPHFTVKPIALMRHLVRLVSDPGQIVLDCFMGSGTTGVAATLEGRAFIGMEIGEEYYKVSELRIHRTQELMKEYGTTDQQIIIDHLELKETKAEIKITADSLSNNPSDFSLAKKLSDLCKKKNELEQKLKGPPKAA